MIVVKPNFDAAGQNYQQIRSSHWDSIANKRDKWNGMGKWYHRRLAEIYRFYVAPNMRVLEIGCADGRLLATLQPVRGVGIDFSEEMIRRAKAHHPNWNSFMPTRMIFP